MRTILTLQSHVAHGRVGNRAAAFTLARMGCETVEVDTVRFSNHPGHGRFTGGVVPAAEVAGIVQGLEALGVLATCDAVLTGYLGTVETGAVALDAVATLRRTRPGALYACDPVMGDDGGGIYVRPGLPEFFRERAIQVADILTPNRFELEWLSAMPVPDVDAARTAASALRARGPRIVLVTSLPGPRGGIAMLAATGQGDFLIETPLLPFAQAPNGAGDCVAALFLATFLETGDAGAALTHCANAIFAVLEATLAAGGRELSLIAAQDGLVAPPRRFAAQRL